jgi:hypothetical protein
VKGVAEGTLEHDDAVLWVYLQARPLEQLHAHVRVKAGEKVYSVDSTGKERQESRRSGPRAARSRHGKAKRHAAEELLVVRVCVTKAGSGPLEECAEASLRAGKERGVWLCYR